MTGYTRVTDRWRIHVTPRRNLSNRVIVRPAFGLASRE